MYSTQTFSSEVLCVGVATELVHSFFQTQVLKALALLRLGRHGDSSVILQEVHAQHPTDDATLQAMAICYREIHKRKMIKYNYFDCVLLVLVLVAVTCSVYVDLSIVCYTYTLFQINTLF